LKQKRLKTLFFSDERGPVGEKATMWENESFWHHEKRLDFFLNENNL